jgi:LCP family protein required for cell wall assembly
VPYEFDVWSTPPQRRGAPPPRRRKRRWLWWLLIPTAIFIYVALAAITLVQPVTVAGSARTVPIPGLPPERLFDLPDGPFTVMVIGLDIRPTQDGPSRTDSILLLRVDPDKNTAGIISIPRDAMMQVPMPDGDTSRDRVNTAYVYNWSRDNPAVAPRALAQTIENNLGLHVDYYLTFDQRGAASIIDAAGGVTVNVEDAFGQEDYSDDDINVVPQLFPTGEQHLDGYRAVAYGRIRKGSNDFERIKRQQQVAEGLVEQLSAPRNMMKLKGVWDAYDGAVETDLTLRQSAGLFVFLRRIGTEKIVTRSLGDATVSCNYCTGALLLLRPEDTGRLIAEAFGDDAAGIIAADRLLSAGVTP